MKKFDYDNINLVPRLCVVSSRSECETKIKMGRMTFNFPAVPANMECVIDDNLALILAKNNYFYIHHRFSNKDWVEDRLKFVEMMNNEDLFTSVSVGVNSDSYYFIDQIIDRNLELDYVTIDIAHGHSLKVKSIIEYIREKMPLTFIIAGNVSTKEAVDDLTDWGADAVKVGIGPGKSCTTWPTTGFGSRNCQASTIYECSRNKKVFIIADGGIRVPGDIAKSIVLGADMVMAGSMFTGFSDSPGEVIETPEGKFVNYWGSASSHQSGKTNRIEGKNTLIPYKNKSILQEFKYLEECLQSSISYGGGKKLKDLRKVKFF